MLKRKSLNLLLFFFSLLILLLLLSCSSANPFPAATPTAEPTCAPEAWPCPSDSLTLTAAPALSYTATAFAPAFPTPTCAPGTWPCPSDSLTLTAAPTYDPSAAAETPTPVCVWPCASDSVTLTAAMSATLGAIPANTPLPWATILPSANDLGWGSVHGKISDGATQAPIAGATVKCEQVPYTPYPCMYTTLTNGEGFYTFTGIFFRKADRIILLVEAPGYAPLRFEEAVSVYPELQIDLGLDLLMTPTALQPALEPIIMCTPPACDGGQLTCGSDTGCPGGCGTVCTLPTP